ncbi:hypothetical protein [Flavivirga eckloniae]|uniref:Uncharacterized protein n=1 Tax=Flavivirga eckloniae TaxID=1803846 RepID=A0A2K9PQZ1_9FLAO|nr:hypothetical protein [Flavivirga eckloniae]AUP79465.1 hypothetical protein C1H87_12410 [Flavivirga eckloniae]
MGLGYFFVNPDKKEYFNPALSGGYLRRRQVFKEELHLYALELLMCEFPGENHKILNKNLRSWSGDRLLVLSDNDWTYPDQSLSKVKNSNQENYPIKKYRDITEELSLYLVENEPEFAEKFIPQLFIESLLFIELVNLNYRIKDKSIENLIVKHFGKDWEKKYRKSFANPATNIDQIERLKRIKKHNKT